MSPETSEFAASCPEPSRGPVRLLAALLVAACATVGCAKKLDMPRVKAEIKAGIEKQSGQPVFWVECPESRKASPGDRFECRAGVEGGAVTLDVVQDEYANAKWTQREVMLDPRAVAETIRTGLKSFAGVDAKVECPATRRPSVPGTRFACEADPSGAAPAYQVAVLVKDVRGQIDWSVPKAAIPASKERPKK